MAVTTDSGKPADEKYSKILKLIVDEPTNYNKIMYSAALGGHIEIVKLMLEKGANNYNWAMECTAIGDHMEIERLMLEKGANDYNWAMKNAASGGHMDIVKLMIEKGANNYNEAMGYAALGGHTDIVTFLETHQKNKLEAKEPEITTDNERVAKKEPEITTENVRVANNVLEIIHAYKPSIEHITEYERCITIIEKIPPNEVSIVIWKAALEDLRNKSSLSYDYLKNLMGYIYNAYPKNEELISFCKFNDDIMKLLSDNRFLFNVNNKLHDLIEKPHRFPPKQNVSNTLSLMMKYIKDMIKYGSKPEDIATIIHCLETIW